MSPKQENQHALAAYRYAVVGLLPLVGLLAGPAAIVRGALGWRAANRSLRTQGGGFALAAVILGLVEVLANGLGVFLIVLGWQALRSP